MGKSLLGIIGGSGIFVNCHPGAKSWAALRVSFAAVRMLVGSWLHGQRTRYLFENEDDARALGLDPTGLRCHACRGGGRRPRAFAAAAPSRRAANSAGKGRRRGLKMIRQKGIAEAVEAVARARQLGSPIELSLFGRPDPSNRCRYRKKHRGNGRRSPGSPGMDIRPISPKFARFYERFTEAAVQLTMKALYRSLAYSLG